MKNQGKRLYAVTVLLSGRTNNFESNPDGSFTFQPLSNKRTSENSVLVAVKKICALGGCKVEKMVKIEKTEVSYDY